MQQESWQLELIISSILLLIIGSFDGEISPLIIKYHSNDGFNFAYVIAILVPLLVFVKSNLIAHIFLRGLWIGCIGLRYISADVDFNSFGYVDKFDRFLKKNIIPFDNYIEKLERICSIIFSYSFLMVFHFLSFSLFFTIIQIVNYFGWKLVYDTSAEPIATILLLFLVFTGILNLIDFITIGKLKKTKYISTFFYPFYRIYNACSLAFLYRPIHYNFISNKLGRTYMLLMLPYMFFLAIIGNEISFRDYIYIPKKENNSNWVMENHYDDMRKSFLEHVSIDQLFYNKTQPIKLFLRVDDTKSNNELIKKLCPEITSYERHNYSVNPFNILDINITTDNYYSETSTQEHAAKIENSLSCMSKMYEVSIDTIPLPALDYVFYQRPKGGEKGLLTGINISALSTGKHQLIVKAIYLNHESEIFEKTIKVPFFIN